MFELRRRLVWLNGYLFMITNCVTEPMVQLLESHAEFNKATVFAFKKVVIVMCQALFAGC